MNLEPVYSSSSYFTNKETIVETLQKDAEYYTRKLEHSRKQADILNQELEETKSKILAHRSSRLSFSESKAKIHSLIAKAAWLEDKLALEKSKLNKSFLENKQLKEKIEFLRRERQLHQKVSTSSSQDLRKMRSLTDRIKNKNFHYKSETENVIEKIELAKAKFARSKTNLRSQIFNLENNLNKSFDSSPEVADVKRPKTPMEMYNLNKYFTEKFGEVGKGKYAEIDKFRKNRKTLISAFNEMRGHDLTIPEVVKAYLSYINQYNSLCKTLGELSESVDKVTSEIKNNRDEISAYKSNAIGERAKDKLKYEALKVKISKIQEELNRKNTATDKISNQLAIISIPLRLIRSWSHNLKGKIPQTNDLNDTEVIFHSAKEADEFVDILSFLKFIKPKPENQTMPKTQVKRKTLKFGEDIEGGNNAEDDKPFSVDRFRAVAKEFAFKAN
ncbi:unnamed protein product [Blepharisma stoltei]|uniref:Uncharacterized protein n=1 Tax=Blepharisma stoltei TaxID=1481888 RepID=A0AAU9JIN7_9CILI|nr:unnamed protein product [Blepharisma stoltei]